MRHWPCNFTLVKDCLLAWKRHKTFIADISKSRSGKRLNFEMILLLNKCKYLVLLGLMLGIIIQACILQVKQDSFISEGIYLEEGKRYVLDD